MTYIPTPISAEPQKTFAIDASQAGEVKPLGLENLTEEQGRQLLRAVERQNAKARKHITAFRRRMVVTAPGMLNRKARRIAEREKRLKRG